MSTEDIPEVPEENKVRGLKAIAIALHVDPGTVKKFAARQKNRLRIFHDHSGYWMDRGELSAWAAGERKTYAEHVREKQQTRSEQTRLAS